MKTLKIIILICLLFDFAFTNAQAINSLTLINANTDTDLRTLVNGGTIDLSVDGLALNIRANVSGTVGSVKFAYDQPNVGSSGTSSTAIENSAPYAMRGDKTGNYNSWTPSLGTHALTVTAYTASGATGTAGTPVTINFNVVNNGAPSGLINWPGGRIAMTFDGNQHDPDDIGAEPFSMALMFYAGLSNKVVHINHSNHLGNNNATMEAKMLESATLGASKFGLPSSILFNCQKQLNEAITHFKNEALKSSASNPLWYCCAGPMEVAWRCLNAVKNADATKLQYIHCVSHSAWNDSHGDTPEMTHTWSKMKTDFPQVVFHHIIDQNSSNGDNDFSSPLSKWYWLRDGGGDWTWLYYRNQFTTKFDPSDAGMVFWVMTGGPNGGNQHGGWYEAKSIFESYNVSIPSNHSCGSYLAMMSKEFPITGGFYLDNYTGQTIFAVKPSTIPVTAFAEKVFNGASCTYNITFYGVGENDGQSIFKIYKNGVKIGEYQLPACYKSYEYGTQYNLTINHIAINNGDKIKIEGITNSNGTVEGVIVPGGTPTWSRARWQKIEFIPVATVKSLLSISEIETSLSIETSEKILSIYPNPAVSDITINDVSFFQRISLYSVTGLKLFEKILTGSDECTINVEYLTEGLYLVLLQSDNGEYKILRFEKQ